MNARYHSAAKHFGLLFVSLLIGLRVGAQPGSGPVKIYVLAGQSNMIGQGEISPATSPGTLKYMVANDPDGPYGFVSNGAGGWTTWDDVWVHFWRSTTTLSYGNLTAGFGNDENNEIGPELGFGYVMGNHHTNQVLLVKTPVGNTTLAVSWRPPSSGGTTGARYLQIMTKVQEAIDNLETYFPDYDPAQGYEIAGFAWHQGWTDRVTPPYVDEYEVNMANFIRDIRNDLGSSFPFVIATTGQGGWDESGSVALDLMAAQLNVAQYPEFQGNVLAVDTRDFWRDGSESPVASGQLHHWNRNALTYLDIGLAMGGAMTNLLSPVRCPTNLRASKGDAGVSLFWTLGTDIPLSIQILRNGVEIEPALAGASTSYLDAGAASGEIEYELVFTMSGDSCDPLSVTVVKYISIPASAGPSGYHVAATEAASFRSTSTAKTHDLDEDDAYGTQGTYFFGNGADNTSNSDGTPSWVTVTSAGVTFVANEPYDDFDDPTEPISETVADWTTTTIGLVNTGTAGRWAELMTFTVDATAPREFRLGVMAGNEQTSDGRWDPAALRLSLSGDFPATVSDLPPTDLGMVFFDVTLPDEVSGTFLIEGQTRSLGSSTRGPSIAGITFDGTVNKAPVADSTSVYLDAGRTASITLSGSDANRDRLTYTVVSEPAHGDVSGEAPNLIYTPTNGFVGADSFTFTVNDGLLDSAPATVSLTVEDHGTIVFDATPTNTTVLHNNGLGTVAGMPGALTYTSSLVAFNNSGFASTETINTLNGTPLTAADIVTIKLSVSGITGDLRANGLLFGMSDYTEWATSTTQSMLVQMDAGNDGSDILIHANSFQDVGDTGDSATDAELTNGFELTLVADVDGYTFTLVSVGSTSPLTYSGTFTGNEFVELFGEGHFLYQAQRYNSGTVPLVSTITEASISVAGGGQTEALYVQWAESAFAAAPEGTDQAATGNPDGDRFNNKMEWALNIDPLTDDQPMLEPSVSNANFVANYERRDPSVTGIDVYASWATSLTSAVWRLVGDGLTETSKGLSNGVETISVSLSPDHTNAFIRIQVEEH